MSPARPAAFWQPRRRDLIKGALAGLAVPAATTLAGGWAIASEVSPLVGRALNVVSDERSPSSQRWASCVGAQGCMARRVDAKASALWSGDPRPLLGLASGQWLSGRTDAALTLCLQQLAANHWYGPRVAIDHRMTGTGWSHRVHAPQTLEREIWRALTDGRARDDALAQVFGHAPPDLWRAPRTSFVVHASRDAVPMDLDGTTTWLLTPVRL